MLACVASERLLWSQRASWRYCALHSSKQRLPADSCAHLPDMARHLLFSILCTSAFIGRVSLTSTGACLPPCEAQNVVKETVKLLQPRPESKSAAKPTCYVHVRTRPEALDCLSGKWVISVGNSWAQATTLALLQVRFSKCKCLTSQLTACTPFRSYLIRRQRLLARVNGITPQLKK